VCGADSVAFFYFCRSPPGCPACSALSPPTPSLQPLSIRGMAEQIANNPAFAQMTSALQESLLGGGAPADAAAAAAASDPARYAEAMSSVLGNPDFMNMAERLGQQIMNVRREREREGGRGGGGESAGEQRGGRCGGVPRCPPRPFSPPCTSPSPRAPPPPPPHPLSRSKTRAWPPSWPPCRRPAPRPRWNAAWPP